MPVPKLHEQQRDPSDPDSFRNAWSFVLSNERETLQVVRFCPLPCQLSSLLCCFVLLAYRMNYGPFFQAGDRLLEAGTLRCVSYGSMHCIQLLKHASEAVDLLLKELEWKAIWDAQSVQGQVSCSEDKSKCHGSLESIAIRSVPILESFRSGNS